MTDQASDNFGAELRHAREQAGVTLRHIADRTKLPVRALKALEDNHITQLPGGIYRRAMVRAYAAEVGLDPQTTVSAFLSRYPDDVPSSAAIVAAEALGWPRVLRGVVSLIGVLIPLLGGAYYFASGTGGSDPPMPIVEVMPPRTEALSPSEVVPVSLAGADSVAMMITISSETRLRVIADDREIVSRRMHQGEVIRLNLSREVILTGDNSGAVHFSINGRAGRTLGEDRTPLNARILRDDYLSWLIQP